MSPRYLVFFLLIVFPAFSADKAGLNALGVKAFEAGDYGEAVAYFTDALRQAPSDQTIAKNLANACRASAGKSLKNGVCEESSSERGSSGQ